MEHSVAFSYKKSTKPLKSIEQTKNLEIYQNETSVFFVHCGSMRAGKTLQAKANMQKFL